MRIVLTVSDVRALLRVEISRAGSQKAVAKRFGISEQYLSDILAGRRDPGQSVLAGMELEKRVTYMKNIFLSDDLRSTTYYLREGGPDNKEYSVCVTQGVEYFYVDGMDINTIRLPQDKDALAGLLELIPKLLADA